MESRFLIAGFGGQGVLLIGQILAGAAMMEGKEVTWIPAYGPEVRGGDANCAVVISDEPIGSPLVTEPPFALILSKPSMIKFAPRILTGGTLVYNASLIDTPPSRTDIKTYAIPCNQIAEQAGNARAANMVMLGALLALCPVVSPENILVVLKGILGDEKAHLIDANRKALEMGQSAARAPAERGNG
jgi:2-oxoglutarate ferredoxin oxidoreductase subunit gamma